MGIVRSMYPEDSQDREIFFAFKKAYEETQDLLIQALTQGDKKYIIQTAQGDILCTLQQCYGSDVVHNSYGHQYHILLERDEKQDGCNIEHRFHPYQESWGLNASSWLVNVKKHGRQYTYDETENTKETSATMLG